MNKNTIPETAVLYKEGKSALIDFVDDIREHAADCSDEVVETRAMALKGVCGLRYVTQEENDLFPGGKIAIEAEQSLTWTGFSQLNSRLNGPNFDWLTDGERCAPPLRERIFNEVLKHRDNTELLLRSKGDLIRAALSTQYSVFDHVDFIDLFVSALGAMGTIGDSATVWNGQVGDVMRAYVLLPAITVDHDPGTLDGRSGGSYDPSGGGLHPAIYISNSEVGTGKVRLTGGVFRTVCSNGMIMGWKANSSLQVVHRHTNRTIVASQVAGMLEQSLIMSEAAIKRFVEAQSILLRADRLSELASRWTKRYGLSTDIADDWEKGARQEAYSNGRDGEHVTLFDFLNGATYLAHSADYGTGEVLQRMAGDMLDANISNSWITQQA